MRVQGFQGKGRIFGLGAKKNQKMSGGCRGVRGSRRGAGGFRGFGGLGGKKRLKTRAACRLLRSNIQDFVQEVPVRQMAQGTPFRCLPWPPQI